MGSSFNLVKKPKKEEDDIEEEEEDIELDDDDSSSHRSKRHSDDDSKKKLILLMGVIIIGTLLLLLILWIASLFSNRNLSYDDMEEVMKEAAISYFKDYPQYLPQNDGDVVEVNADNLVVAEKMKSLSEYRTDGVVCTGTVQVQKSGDEYLYIPFLNCGENYYSIELAKKIETDNPVTTAGEGLYSSNSNLVFRGENVNNYVQLENSLWRIVKVTSDANVVLIHADGLDYYQPWDNRYNEERLYESGINTYNVSRMKEYLEKIYKNPSKDDGEEILSDKDKARLVSYPLCVGTRAVTSESKTNNEECRQKVQNTKLGLLTLSEYLYASLDTTCKSANTKSCMNYNYLSMDDEWWLVTANSENTSTVYKVDRTGVVKADIASTYSKVRPVIYLNSHIMYASGKGSKDDPYKIK